MPLFALMACASVSEAQYSSTWDAFEKRCLVPVSKNEAPVSEALNLVSQSDRLVTWEGKYRQLWYRNEADRVVCGVQGELGSGQGFTAWRSKAVSELGFQETAPRCMAHHCSIEVIGVLDEMSGEIRFIGLDPSFVRPFGYEEG